VKDDDNINVMALMLVGGRLTNERSYAARQHLYGNPANVVRMRGERMDRYDEVERLLDLWADWMRKPELLTEGYPAKASGGFIESWRKDSEELADNAEADRLDKINACFDSLQRIYQVAINKHYGLGHDVWRFGQPATFF